MPETVIETDFMQWFIKNEHGVLNTTKLHVASAAWSAGYQAAQQMRAADTSPLCPECKVELHLTTAGDHVCRNEACGLYR